jgi:hypothetical protein
MEVKYPPIAWVHFQLTTENYNPEGRNIRDHRDENLKLQYPCRFQPEINAEVRFWVYSSISSPGTIFAAIRRNFEKHVKALCHDPVVLPPHYSSCRKDDSVFTKKEPDLFIHLDCVSTSKTLHIVKCVSLNLLTYQMSEFSLSFPFRKRFHIS